jgi:hypothetical protein
MSAALTLDDNNTKRSSTMRSSMARGTKGFEGFKGGVKGTIKGATALPGGAIKGVGNAAQVCGTHAIILEEHSSFCFQHSLMLLSVSQFAGKATTFVAKGTAKGTAQAAKVRSQWKAKARLMEMQTLLVSPHCVWLARTMHYT